MRWLVAVLGLSIALVAACADEDLARRITSGAAAESTEISVPGLAARGPRVVRASPVAGPGRPRDQVPVFYRYEVKEGDTIVSIARMFNLRPESVAWNNEGAPGTGELRRGTLLDIPSVDGILHRIRVGETLSEIAAQYGVEMRAILEFPSNGLGPGAPTSAGGVILVPGGLRPEPFFTGAPPGLVCVPGPPDNRIAVPLIHVAAEGDTVESIADRYCVRPETVRRSNPSLAPDGRLEVGTVFNVPSRDGLLYRLRPDESFRDAVERLVPPGTAFMGVTGDPPPGSGLQSVEFLFIPDR